MTLKLFVNTRALNSHTVWIVLFIISIINYEGNIDKKLQTLSISLSFAVKKILNDIILLLIVILRVKMYNNPVVSQILNRYKSAW